MAFRSLEEIFVFLVFLKFKNVDSTTQLAARKPWIPKNSDPQEVNNFGPSPSLFGQLSRARVPSSKNLSGRSKHYFRLPLPLSKAISRTKSNLLPRKGRQERRRVKYRAAARDALVHGSASPKTHTAFFYGARYKEIRVGL